MTGGALEPWAEAGSRGETVLQVAASNPELLKALEPVMREHLADRPVEQWSSQVRGRLFRSFFHVPPAPVA